VAAVLEVTSSPSGATVSVDGTLRGQTPLRLDDLSPGEYRIMLTRDGYLENTQVVTLLPAASDTISVTLTAVAATQQVIEDSGGGSKLKWILPIVGGAAAAAAVLLGPGGDATTPPGERVTETLTGTVGTPLSSAPVSLCVFGGGHNCQLFKFTTTTGGTFEVTLEWGVPSSVLCVDLDLYFTGSGITGEGPRFAGTTVDQCAAYRYRGAVHRRFRVPGHHRTHLHDPGQPGDLHRRGLPLRLGAIHAHRSASALARTDATPARAATLPRLSGET
jgi:hypothetical protein